MGGADGRADGRVDGGADGAAAQPADAVRVRGLSKSFRARAGRRRVALDRLDLTVPAGGVHGLLGPNGSGKSTTVAILLGLVRADAGEVALLGHPVPRGLPAALPAVGAVLQQPAFHPGLTARRTLRLLADLPGADRDLVDQALDLVGLAGRGRDRVRGFSPGLRQRLALAAALVKRPRLLILDEPTHGLDPEGVGQVRGLVRAMAAGGTTVLLSSPLLTDVVQVCDTVTVLVGGRAVRSGPVGEVLRGPGTGRVRVQLPDVTAGIRVLGGAGMVVHRDNGGILVSGVADPAAIVERLAHAGLYVSGLIPVQADVESVFLELVRPTVAAGEHR